MESAMCRYNKNQEQWKGKVQLISISADQDKRATLMKLAEKGWKSFEYFHNRFEKKSQEIEKLYLVTTIPFFVLVAPDGTIVYQGHPGKTFPEDRINNLVSGKEKGDHHVYHNLQVQPGLENTQDKFQEMKKFIFQDLQHALQKNFLQKEGMIKFELRKIQLHNILVTTQPQSVEGEEESKEVAPKLPSAYQLFYQQITVDYDINQKQKENVTKIINLVLAQFTKQDLIATKALISDPQVDLINHLSFVSRNFQEENISQFQLGVSQSYILSVGLSKSNNYQRISDPKQFNLVLIKNREIQLIDRPPRSALKNQNSEYKIFQNFQNYQMSLTQKSKDVIPVLNLFSHFESLFQYEGSNFQPLEYVVPERDKSSSQITSKSGRGTIVVFTMKKQNFYKSFKSIQIFSILYFFYLQFEFIASSQSSKSALQYLELLSQDENLKKNKWDVHIVKIENSTPLSDKDDLLKEVEKLSDNFTAWHTKPDYIRREEFVRSTLLNQLPVTLLTNSKGIVINIGSSNIEKTAQIIADSDSILQELKANKATQKEKQQTSKNNYKQIKEFLVEWEKNEGLQTLLNMKALEALEKSPVFVLQIQQIKLFDEKTGTLSDTPYFTKPLISLSAKSENQEVFKTILDKVKSLVPIEELNMDFEAD